MPSFHSIFTVLALSSVGLSTLLPIIGPKKYDVAITTFALNDASRMDPFAKDKRTRSIVASAYFPIANCHTKKSEPYMPPATASFQSEKFAAYGLPSGTFSTLELDTCSNFTPAQRGDVNAFPLVLFSGGLDTSRLLYSNMLQSIAATGFTVVSVDHPYDADFVEFPDGTTATAVDISTDADIALALSTRITDLTFLHAQLTNRTSPHHIPNLSPTTPIAIFGHSLGGATAAAMTTTTTNTTTNTSSSSKKPLPALRGALNMDGSMFGPLLTTGTSTPLMLLAHQDKSPATDPSWAAVWPRLTGWKAQYQVLGAAHYSFSDLPLIAAQLQQGGMALPEGAELLLGSVPGARMQDVSVSYVAAFCQFVLGKAGGERAFRKLGAKFTEVKKME